jgi:hypothetical protein
MMISRLWGSRYRLHFWALCQNHLGVVKRRCDCPYSRFSTSIQDMCLETYLTTEVLVYVKINNAVYWDVTWRSLVEIYWRCRYMPCHFVRDKRSVILKMGLHVPQNRTVHSESRCALRLRYVDLVVSKMLLKCAVVLLYSVAKQLLNCNTGKVFNCLIHFNSGSGLYRRSWTSLPTPFVSAQRLSECTVY